MVGPAPLPSSVAAFVSAHIGTLERLELLLLLMQSSDRWWDASTVSRELGYDAESARRALDHLAAHNLLAIRVTADVRYQYQPGEPRLADAAAMFAQAFQMNPVAVLQLVTPPKSRSIRDFAAAFRIRRDDDR
jgi:hypothetical protein